MRRELDTQIVSGFLKNVQIYIYIENIKLSKEYQTMQLRIKVIQYTHY
jgi:hypothetical protein